ncbi:MAG: serine hydrolase domain-containing protein [Deltaproteobacteria bacterium]|nr:serine hydrolase domain-containing protein [Deltaproteobacteria bacterium]
MTHPIDNEMNRALKDGVFPSASLLVGRGPDLLWEKIYGEALPETLFDIASLTKPVCTATLFMMAVREEKVKLDDEVREGITIRHLLNHTSGLPAYKKYYLDYASGEEERLVERILREPLEQKPGEKVVYSDLGYILLGDILQKTYGISLANLFSEKIAGAFEMEHTFFEENPPYPPFSKGGKEIEERPPHSYPPLKKGGQGGFVFAPTGHCPWRKRTIVGCVMDEHAYLLGGAAGHAGLFSTAADLRTWLLKMNEWKKEKILAPFFSVPKNRDLKIPFFTLGFDTPSSPSSSGKYFSSQSLGHLGYSGCSFWWDPEADFFVICLTNRVHPSRENEKIRAFRPHLHDLIVESFKP